MLDISNMDFTFFAGFNNVTTAADPGQKTKLYGFAGFADLLRGYLDTATATSTPTSTAIATATSPSRSASATWAGSPTASG